MGTCLCEGGRGERMASIELGFESESESGSGYMLLLLLILIHLFKGGSEGSVLFILVLSSILLSINRSENSRTAYLSTYAYLHMTS